MKKVIIVLIVVLIAGVVAFFLLNKPDGQTGPNTNNPTGNPTGFNPFGGNPTNNGAGNQASTTENDPFTDPGTGTVTIPKLRLLSNTPVGGFGASTTGSTTVVRWIDRGRGNVTEVNLSQAGQVTVSNSIVPRIMESVWNKNLTSFVGARLMENMDEPSYIFAELTKNKPSTTTDSGVEQAQYELTGKSLRSNVVAMAVSPSKDKIFILVKESGRGIGYVSNFDGSKMTQIFDTPITSANVEWPETNTITLTTKGIASQSGFLYFVNPSTGSMNKILGPIYGLSTKVSRDAKYVFASSAGNNGGVDTAILKVSTNDATDAVVRTLADKCSWGNFYKNIVYCAVPTLPPKGTLPDDWYRGTTSFVDKIWQINAETGEVKLISVLIEEADRSIDGFNLITDNKDEYLTFMNKTDLSLWSLDLVTSE